MYKESFLICFNNDDSAAIFHSGKPIGTIQNEIFSQHEFTNPNGDKIPIKVDEEFILKVKRLVAGL